MLHSISAWQAGNDEPGWKREELEIGQDNKVVDRIINAMNFLALALLFPS
jgi:hypothetical protein